MEWQPIDTAPKDGTRILVWNAFMGAYSTHHKNGEWPFFMFKTDLERELTEGGDIGVWYPQPSHWCHLPPPPSSGDQ